MNEVRFDGERDHPTDDLASFLLELDRVVECEVTDKKIADGLAEVADALAAAEPGSPGGDDRARAEFVSLDGSDQRPAGTAQQRVEMERLLSEIRDLATSVAQVLVQGDPGVGKSALLANLGRLLASPPGGARLRSWRSPVASAWQGAYPGTGGLRRLLDQCADDGPRLLAIIAVAGRAGTLWPHRLDDPTLPNPAACLDAWMRIAGAVDPLAHQRMDVVARALTNWCLRIQRLQSVDDWMMPGMLADCRHLPPTQVEMLMPLTLVDSPGAFGTAVNANLVYQAADPFAVHILFMGYAPSIPDEWDRPGQNVTWSFSRELLQDGLNRRVGIGDVQVWPGYDDAVMLSLRSPDGSALLQAPRDSIDTFLQRSYRAIPPGKEEEFIEPVPVPGIPIPPRSMHRMRPEYLRDVPAQTRQPSASADVTVRSVTRRVTSRFAGHRHIRRAYPGLLMPDQPVRSAVGNQQDAG